MKLKLAMLAFIALTLLASCTPKNGNKDGEQSGIQAESKESKFSIGFVTDIGGIDDKSFNQGTWEGVKKFIDEKKLPEKNYTYLQSSTDADYIPNLSTLADDGFSIVVAAGFLFVDAINEVSKNFPETKFLIIDQTVDSPNVVSAIFNEEQGSFLVGVIAAKQAQKDGVNKVGFVGGSQFDVIHRFEAGYEAGIKSVDPNMEILIEYAESFADPQTGQSLAAKIYDAGATVVFNVAGSTGNGGIKEAKDRVLNGEKVWAIGVDRDQYADGIYEDAKSVILTSMVKRVDVAAHDVIQMAYDNKFEGGKTLIFNLENGGVSLPDNNPNVSSDIMAEVEMARKKILSGEVVVPKKPSRL